MPMSPEQRSLRGRVAAHESWARTADPAARTAAARANTPQGLPYWERKVAAEYPELPEGERRRRAEHLYRAHMARLSLRSSQARTARKAAEAGDAA